MIIVAIQSLSRVIQQSVEKCITVCLFHLCAIHSQNKVNNELQLKSLKSKYIYLVTFWQ